MKILRSILYSLEIKSFVCTVGVRADDFRGENAGNKPPARAVAAVHAQEGQDRGHGATPRKGSGFGREMKGEEKGRK